jgi:hypothetical protein
MAPLYKPPTRVTTIQIPYQALVSRADPNWNRYKFREIEYEFSGKVFLANPYQRGPYDTPVKTVTINYTDGTTFAAGDITGVGFDFVKVNSTNANPGIFTTRTAAQMFTDIVGATLPMAYYLRINNIGGQSEDLGAQITIAAGAGVSLSGAMSIPQNTYSDFVVSFIDTQTAVITTQTFENLYQSVSH